MKVWPVVSESLKVKHINNDLEMWAPKFYYSITILLQWLDACSDIQVRKSEKADCVGKRFSHSKHRTEQNQLFGILLQYDTEIMLLDSLASM